MLDNMPDSRKRLLDLFSNKNMSIDEFLTLNKAQILKSHTLTNAFFHQYKNYLYKMSKRILERYPHIETDELVSEGFEGLLKALEKYNCKESSFLTYAQHWVRMKMLCAARKTVGNMALPGGMYSVIAKIRAMQDEDPGTTHDKLVLKLNESSCQVAIALSIIHSPKFGGDQSLEEYITYEDSLNRDPDMDDSFDSIFIKADCRKKFWKILKKSLLPKELFVLELLFGKYGQARRSLEWTAKVLNVSKERIRQIKESAFSKIREAGIMEKLLFLKD